MATLLGGKRKVNKSLKNWVAFVKRVQKEEKLSYKDAIHRAKQRKDKGEKWMKGGDEPDPKKRQISGEEEEEEITLQSTQNLREKGLEKEQDRESEQAIAQAVENTNYNTDGDDDYEETGGGKTRKKRRCKSRGKSRCKRRSKSRGKRRSKSRGKR